MAAVIETGAKVTAITRQGADKVLSQGRETKPFVLAVSNGNGAIRRDLARAVIDASGTWTAPNPSVRAESSPRARPRTPNTSPTASRTSSGATAPPTRQDILVVGAGHSAANVLLDLARLAERDPGPPSSGPPAATT